MIKIKVDPHTHTLFSGHAFNTITENAIAAERAGLEAIGMTDHYGPLFCDLSKFGAAMNMDALPKVIHHVRILAGTEIDIVDMQGTLAGMDTVTAFNDKLSAGEMLLRSRELTIASVHNFKGVRDADAMQATQLYCNVLHNPYVDVIGHCGRSGMPFDIDEVVKTAAKTHKMIEINAHSFTQGAVIQSRCREIALACARHGAPIVVSSDAHSLYSIGKFDAALSMLDDIQFPEALVMNTSLDKLLQHLALIRNDRSDE